MVAQISDGLNFPRVKVDSYPRSRIFDKPALQRPFCWQMLPTTNPLAAKQGTPDVPLSVYNCSKPTLVPSGPYPHALDSKQCIEPAPANSYFYRRVSPCIVPGKRVQRGHVVD
jgi:hypothetical protein